MKEHAPNSSDSPNIRILVVDDEPTLRLGFSFALATENFDVETAADGLVGLEAISDSHFDAVLLDLRMPQMDGLQTLSKLRASGDHIPVILCSAHITPASALAALELRCFDFLAKPVNPIELRKGVNRIFAPSPQTDADRMLRHLRNGDNAAALQVLSDSTGLSDSKKKFWRQLINDLETQSKLNTDFYVENYGRDLIPLLSFQEH